MHANVQMSLFLSRVNKNLYYMVIYKWLRRKIKTIVVRMEASFIMECKLQTSSSVNYVREDLINLIPPLTK